MDAESAWEFDQLSLEVGLSLWGGKVRIFGVDDAEGTEYDAEVTIGPRRVQLAENEGGGEVTILGLSARIPKAVLPGRPENGLVIEHEVSGTLERFLIDSVSGDGADSSAWFVRGVKWPD